MKRDQILEAANLLLSARRGGAALKSFPSSCRPLTAADANEIGDEVTKQLGDDVGGWKITFLYKPREKPFRAPIFTNRIFSTPAQIPLALGPSRYIEPEITFRLKHDLAPRSNLYRAAEVADAVEACPSFEIVATRFDTSERTLRDMLNQRTTLVEAYADHITNGAFVIGKPIKDWQNIDFATMKVSMRAEENLIVETVGGHAFVDPFLPVVILANELRHGPGLKAGNIVATGSFSGYFAVEVNQTVTAEFEHVGQVEAKFIA